MFKKVSIRWRLTILSAILLTVCCVGLTVVLHHSAFRMIDSIDSIVVTDRTDDIATDKSDDSSTEMTPSGASESIQNAKQNFNMQSLIYMLLVICGGSTLTYYVVGKALKPLEILNRQVKKININNLSGTLEIPVTKDEISELTQSFNEMTNKLNHAFSLQKRFSANAAHELRTPLTILKTKVDVFKKKHTHTMDEYETLISVFDKQIIRLRGLIGNLLSLSNMDDEREQSCICLKDMFEEIVNELSIVAKKQNIVFTIHSDESTITGNVELLYLAFYNLIENAIKYNKKDGTVDITILTMADGHAQIRISDSGIGIPDEMKQHIFEPFYRVDESRSRDMGGAGLGLSIVDIIIKKHDGSIAVSNRETEGTCFQIIL